MKIIHINLSDKIGGAAIAAYRLHCAMIDEGIDSKYLVLERMINDRSDIITVSKYSKFFKRQFNIIFDKIKRINILNTEGLFSNFRYGINVSKIKEIKNADIIYLHWINNFINYNELIKLLKLGKFVFWFMHDMFPITGGCHHSFDCNKYIEKCCKCKYQNKKNILFRDIAKTQFKIKLRIYSRYKNLKFIAPSKWLYQCGQNSTLLKKNNIYHIPNLIDTNIYRYIDKKLSRFLFFINKDIKIIGIGADSVLTNPYKGWNYFLESLHILSRHEQLKNIKIEILIFGSSYSREIADSIPFASHFLGRLHDDYSMTMAYNCMDVFVISSLADNFPNTILESLACNTPIVGFNIGGISDTVNENTGYLAEYKNSRDLAYGISNVLLENRENISCCVSKYSKENIVSVHKEIWKLLNK